MGNAASERAGAPHRVQRIVENPAPSSLASRLARVKRACEGRRIEKLRIRARRPFCRNVAGRRGWSYLLGDTAGALPAVRKECLMRLARSRLQLRLATVLFVTLGVLAITSAVRPPSAFAATLVATDADKGGSVRLKAGDILEVHLKSNPTTGYQWYVHPKSTPLMKPIGASQTQARQPGVGRPILQVFRFQAVAAGEGVVLLHYVRSWERATADEEQFGLHVSIH